MKYKDIKENEEVQALISKGNENLGILGILIIQKYIHRFIDRFLNRDVPSAPRRTLGVILI